MTAYLLFHSQTSGWGREYAWIDKWASMGGLTPVIIDPVKPRNDNPEYAPLVFWTMQEAVESPLFKDAQWVYFDPNARLRLDELEHPTGDVVYALGSDYFGFGATELPEGVSVSILGLPETWAGMCVPCLVYDRIVKGVGNGDPND